MMQNTEIENAYKKLNELDSARVEALLVIMHQLRSPLSTAELAHEVLLRDEDGTLSEKQKYIIENSLERVQQAYARASDMLRLATTEEIEAPLELQTSALEPFLDKFVERVSLACEAKNIQCNTQYGTDSRAVSFDRKVLGDAVQNLLDNAIVYAPENTKITLSTAYDSDGVTIAVADEGPGVPPDQVVKLFNKFTRFENVHGAHPDGAGLGLYIAHRALTRHSGTLQYHPNTPTGSIFSMYIPAGV